MERKSRIISQMMLILALFVCSAIASTSTDSQKSIGEYLLSYGYSFQEHKVVSPDGYITTLWRIPRNLKNKGPKGPPVLIQHGILDNGFSFLFQSIQKNLPILLIDEGNFDIWISNSRGTFRSLEHVNKEKYNWEDANGAFWDFSWDEMGKYDLPAIVDYIVQETGYPKMKYVCHSQGCTMLFALSCLNLTYANAHFDQVVALAPAMYFNYQKSSFIELFVKKLHVLSLLESAHYKNGLAHPAVQQVSKTLGSKAPKVWLSLIDDLCGESGDRLEETRVSVLAANECGGTSLQNTLHWMQGLENTTFRMHDFGKEKNLVKYGSPYAPAYEIGKLKEITYPLLLFAFQNDTLITPTAVKRLLLDLPENGFVYEEVPNCNHVSGYWGDAAYKELFPKILSFFKRYPVQSEILM